MKSTEDT